MRVVVGLLAAVAAVPAVAQSIPAPEASAQGNVAVTIYNNNLALVQDRRELTLPAGRSRQEFPDVSAQIRAETVTLAGSDIGIVEQNFDYDLLSPSALMQKAVGETITIVRINPATGAETRERARVLAANGGVVLQIGDRIEVLRDDGLPVRVIFDKVPEGLRPRPTLSVTLTAPRGGRQPVTLTYLTPGLGWDADYVALFDEAAGRMNVQGWITLNNQSGTAYRNAEVVLVAGAVGGEAQRYDGRFRPSPPPPLRNAGTETANRERIGDYYLYPLPERTTIAQAQQKQVSFLDVSGAPAQRAYEYRNGWLGSSDQPVSANTVLRFSTGRTQGLGDALPAGTVRVYQRDSRGTPQFVGESRIGHTPMGSELGLTTGQAFDIKVQPTVEQRTRLDSDGSRWRTAMRYKLTNASPRPVTVVLFQDGLWGDTRIVSESQKSERNSADAAIWRVAVPANGEASVTAVFDTRY
ncbi:DUF4139 domain-containing protein [Sphingomonas astaxanthinifaciens]|uniref:DUF4139 domain-containing protein n=1 Tax=Sphingomonas astaxanthinifaciens DSM 22298 TaxID=1123267 RepID=A0ABQ5Z7Y7_9SPHN|nr:DUF4139 domain-containing protein [Sphingomonas astaxanthinifaciens]GLR47566.1 hypothetical protein GCM10007925_12780 [Sphingomonas astaxanthinifaciens DSM 22298]